LVKGVQFELAILALLNLNICKKKLGASPWMAARLLLMNPFFDRNMDFS
jgi:hypothetical protein